MITNKNKNETGNVLAQQAALQIAESLRLPQEIAVLLVQRGISTPEDAHAFLNPDLNDLTPPAAYKGLATCADRIQEAIERGEVIVIYGDYDCDGVCGAAILYRTLSKLCEQVYYFIPDRNKDGYGLSTAAVIQIAEEYLPDLLITVDCGISALEEIEFIQQELGIDVLVTDHHECGEALPNCPVFNPKNEENGFQHLCGAAVAMLLAEKISEIKDEENLILAAIATIADAVPLIGDNRIIAAAGLAKMPHSRILGIKTMLSKLNLGAKVEAYDIAFKIAPRINALGRLSNANPAVELFLSDDYFEVDTLLQSMENSNEKRQQLTEEIYQDALHSLESSDLAAEHILVLKSDRWDAGVIGIVCSKLAEQFNRPVLLMCKDEDRYKGSGRSIHGVDLYALIAKNSERLIRFGGHPAACGFSVHQDDVACFMQQIRDFAKTHIDKRLIFNAEVQADIEIDGPPDLQFCAEIKRLAPFGVGNPEPMILNHVQGLRFKKIGKTNHIKALKNQTEYLLFNGADKQRFLNAATYDLLVKCSVAEYENRIYPQAVIKEVRYASDTLEALQELVAADYLKQAFKDEEGITKCKSLLKQTAKEWIQAGAGVCFLGFRAESVVAFYQWVKEIGAEIPPVFEVGFLKKTNPVNRVVLACDASQDLGAYDKIVLLDPALSSEFLDFLRLKRTANVYILEDFDKTPLFNVPNYEGFGIIYRQIKQVLNSNKTERFEEIAAALPEVAYLDTFIVFCTLYDLKIIKQDAAKRFYVDASVKKPLTESEFYKKVSRLHESH